MQKLDKCINQKVNWTELILIPHRIKIRCIGNAKTNKAKQRLVYLTELAARENMKRLHCVGYKYFKSEQDKEPESFFHKFLKLIGIENG